MEITFTLNGKKVTLQIDADTLLIDLVRDLGCYSVKRGCETSNCGLCTVFMDDQPILSCSILAARVDGHMIDTLEGLQEDAAEFGAFIANQGAEQCGFCNPGMIMNAIALFREIPDPTEEEIKDLRADYGIKAAYKMVDTCAAEFAAETPYYYSVYGSENEVEKTDAKKKVLVLGSGPIRIGQGIEFDYCCVHASQALKKMGFETIIVNCNPETVSTDYDTSDKLYFEPLTVEDVLSIYNKEKPLGVIAQFGGQTPLNIAAELEKNGVKILGTSPSVIDLAEDRDLFREMMDKLEIPMPESGMATTVEEALEIAGKIGYPVMVRPSYVLGGRGMEVVYDDESMAGYMKAAVGVTPDRSILIDRFLNHAMECEADAISDGTHAFVPAVMEHIELAGVHSGDSACILPSVHISEENLETIKEYTRKIAEEMHV